MTEPRDKLSNPETAAIAWARFRYMMKLVATAAVLAIGVVLAYLHWTGVPMPMHMIIATCAGVGFTVLLGGALMALVFMSAGTGHDSDVMDLTDDRERWEQDK